MNETSRLLKIIEENNMTYGEFAKRIGASLGSVKRWVGERTIPTGTENVKRICEEFNISADWLIFGVGDMHW